jgi:hypothetical protein
MFWLFAALLAIPLGLDLYMPVPEAGGTLTITETAHTLHEPNTRRI